MPSAPYVVPPLLLAIVLVVSGAAKLRHPADSAKVFRQLQLPPALGRWQVPRLLPYAELVLAGTLVLTSGWSYLLAATLSVLLFLAYLGVVFRGLRLPYPLTCGCFGRLGLGLITRRTVWRNAWLLAVAAITWLDAWRGDGVVERLRGRAPDTASVSSAVVWWLVMVALAMVVTAVVVHNESGPNPAGPASDAADTGDESDTYPRIPTPYAVLDGPDGPASVWQLGDAAARLLVFCALDDPVGDRLEERVPRWVAELPALRVHVVGPSHWDRLASDHAGLAPVLLGDADDVLARRLNVEAPGAVILGTDRFLAGGPVHGFEEIEDLVAQAGDVLRAAQSSA